MAIKDGNQQVTFVIPDEYVKLIDRDASANFRSRSQQIAMIVIEYYKNQEKQQD